jgi:hypothetical protein
MKKEANAHIAVLLMQISHQEKKPKNKIAFFKNIL